MEDKGHTYRCPNSCDGHVSSDCGSDSRCSNCGQLSTGASEKILDIHSKLIEISHTTPKRKDIDFAVQHAVVGNVLLHKILSSWFQPENLIQNMNKLKPERVIRWGTLYHESLVYFLGEQHVETVEFLRGMEPYRRMTGV